MPWCPKCKTEYREGVTSCADCGNELVAFLDEEPEYRMIANIAEEELADKFIKYLKFDSIDGRKYYNENTFSYEVSVPIKAYKEAKKAFTGFYAVESQRLLEQECADKEAADVPDSIDDNASALEESSSSEDLSENDSLDDYFDADSDSESEMDEEESEEMQEAMTAQMMYKPATVYEKKSDTSKEMTSTAFTFIFFAAALLIFMLLNIIEVITIFNNLISLTLIGLMAVGCCLVGLNALKRAKKAQAEAVEEEKLTAELNKWLLENITKDSLEKVDLAEFSEEANYIRRLQYIKKALYDNIGELDEAYADNLVEEFYYSNFDETATADEDTDEETDI